jgi:AraC family transcriptional regulator of adaptative response/methylated-DNA-[protein]-cysteine methyltransferase
MELTINSKQSQDYEKIGQAIRYLEEHQLEQPGLADLAIALHMSEYHLQRLFSRWVGISPKRFMQYLTKEHAKYLLDQSRDVLNTAHSVGLSGPGRLHDIFITCEAMTPGEYKSKGAGLKVGYGIHPSPFGDCLVGVTQRGICSLIFLREGDQAAALSDLISSWPAAQIEEDKAGTADVVAGMQSLFRDELSTPLRIYLHGSNFQIKVWEALMQIPTGSVASYQQVAVQIGMPGASRAVGNAVARNPIPVLIPCHRVIRQNGEFGNYRYGKVRKKAILGYEMARYDMARSTHAQMMGA